MFSQLPETQADILQACRWNEPVPLSTPLAIACRDYELIADPGQATPMTWVEEALGKLMDVM